MIANAWVVWLILLLPLGAFLVVGLIGRRFREGGGYVVVGAMAGSLVLSLYVFVQVLSQGGLGGNFAPQTVTGYIWLPSIPGNEIRISILIDNLSSLMLVLVSFLCLLIFIYSLGYMHEEEGKPRYYAEVSLFATGMLGTVSADNFLQLLIFWEIMGLCSYLLIGFWYHKPEAAAAAKKAFLVTRVGDVLFLVAVLIIWNEFGTLRFNEIAPRVGLLNGQLLTLIPLLLFGGAVGKSAQFPLHTWLPDAMEGPTTVSALIHAATMVKAGVYLTARSFIFLVPLAPGVEPPFTAILVIAAIGGFTTLFAASMAVVNNDIKRVLAFSTISQLGYMFLGLGAGAFVMATDTSRGVEVNSAGYSAALYHLFNHAFFKALLFLSAGSVIHAVDTNDMREMGGLSGPMPVTSRVMLFGALAFAGIAPFSGFFSKGDMLSVAFDAGADQPGFYLLYAFGLLTAFLTAFYAFIHRMLTKRYWTDDVYDAFGRNVVVGLARGLDWFDRNVIDGIVNAVGRGGMRVAVQSDAFDRRVIDGAVNAVSLETIRTSWRLRQRQTGQVQSYAWVIVVGLVVLFFLMFGQRLVERFLGGP